MCATVRVGMSVSVHVGMCVCVYVCVRVSLPEEGMVLYADLPQAFRSPVVG